MLGIVGVLCDGCMSVGICRLGLALPVPLSVLSEVNTSCLALLGTGLDTLSCITDGRDSFVRGLKIEIRLC